MENVTLKLFVDDEVNIEYKLFINHAGEHCVRVWDLDALEIVNLAKCKDAAQAEGLYKKTVDAVKKINK
jgi:hypothetical protein